MEPYGETTVSYTIVALRPGRLPLPLIDITSDRFGTFLVREQTSLKEQQQESGDDGLATTTDSAAPQMPPVPCILVSPLEGQLPN